MSLAVVRSRAPASGRAPEVTVEVHLANGLPSFSIVGRLVNQPAGSYSQTLAHAASRSPVIEHWKAP
ncbi:hypothetical protein B0G73_109190 [Paraburkholderia sp. BL25I1N1]|nr:hypothetical protein B0G73_109190 [Paraburkholderia sp. BL25I1N1]